MQIISLDKVKKYFKDDKVSYISIIDTVTAIPDIVISRTNKVIIEFYYGEITIKSFKTLKEAYDFAVEIYNENY